MSENALTTAGGTPDFTADQVQLLRDTVCKGATETELRLFVEVCRSRRLDPFARQIHAVKRPAKDDRGGWTSAMTFQTGIDGYRLIAERTGKYAGQDAPMWCGEDGVWKEIWVGKTPPFAARAGVYRTGFVQPMIRVARYSAYAQTKQDGTPNAMWQKMGPEQLHKCAESIALRAAFPEELSGLYTREEMGQAENAEPTRAEAVQAARAVGERKLAEMKGEYSVVEASIEPGNKHAFSPEDMAAAGPPQQGADWVNGMMEAFDTMKRTIGEGPYRAALTDAGYNNKAELMRAGRKAAAAVYKAMAKAAIDLKNIADTRAEIQELANLMGDEFDRRLGNLGYVAAELPGLNWSTLASLLESLKAYV